MALIGKPRSDFDTSTSIKGPAGNHPRPPMPLTGKANGRMHHHDKHAASKDGHRPDDPHAVTGWKQEEIDIQASKARKAIFKTEQANSEDFDALTQRQANIQAVLDEPTIRREGHEVFDENVNYGQRVSAFGNIERTVSDEQGGGYDVQGDEMVDLVEGEEDQAYAKVGTYGQWEDKIQAANEAEANAREQTGFTGHVGVNELLGMGTPQGNAVGRARQKAGAEPKPKPDTDPLGDKGSYKGHIGINEYLGLGDKEGNRIAAERQARGSKEIL